jgi:hypothetical protein
MSNFTKKRLLDWRVQFLDKIYNTDRSMLIVSGCSFTDSSVCTDAPVSWPGYVKDRCGFDLVIDVSSSGNGNDYISTSIVNQIEAMSADDLKKTMVLIVWTGIDRRELPTYERKINLEYGGYVDSVNFRRAYTSSKSVDNDIVQGEALRSWKNIMMMQNYLENKNIPFGFGFYVNVFDPPFLPRRDLTKEFPGFLDPLKINQLRKCNWFHKPNDSFFEWTFYQKDNLFENDGFHPNIDGHLGWTDNVVLPGLARLGLIWKVDQKRPL